MSRVDTWMPLYIGDYLADTMKLNGAQHGAYLLLIMDYWRNGPLTDDDEELANTARTQLSDWKKKVGPSVRAFFKKGEDGKLHHTRIDAELDKAERNNDQRVAAGKASAAKRAVQRKTNETTTDDQRKFNDRSTSVDDPLVRNGRPSPSPNTVVVSDTDGDRARPTPAAASSDPFPRYPNPPGKPPMPCRGDPPDAWKHLAPLEADGDGPKRAAAGGYFLDTAAELVCEAAQIRDERWRGDWRPLIAWLRDNIDLHAVIIPAIRQVAARPNYRVPSSLQYFDTPVRQAHASAAA